MADGVEIKVDATRAQLKLERVPVAVRDNLRAVLPPLVRQLAGVVDANLATGLKSRKTLTTNQEIRENAKGITGVVSVTSPSANGLLPHYLEEGTEAHKIEGNPVLAFPWDFMGGYGGSVSANTTMAFFRSVRHPGFTGLHYMQHAFDSMQSEIVDTLREAAQTAARGVR